MTLQKVLRYFQMLHHVMYSCRNYFMYTSLVTDKLSSWIQKNNLKGTEFSSSCPNKKRTIHWHCRWAEYFSKQCIPYFMIMEVFFSVFVDEDWGFIWFWSHMNCLRSKQISDADLTWLGVKCSEGTNCKMKLHTIHVKYLSRRHRSIFHRFGTDEEI